MNVEKLRAVILAEFNSWHSVVDSDPAELMKRVLKQTDDLSQSTEPETLLTRYFWCMIACKIHLQHTILTDSQLNALFETTRSMLQLSRIQAFGHPLSYLYGDLEVVASQVAMRNGKVWGALWHQSSAEKHEEKSRRQLGGFHQLGKAIRLARLGFYQLALTELADAESCGLADSMRATQASCMAKCLRMTQRFDEFDDHVKHASKRLSEDATGLEELRFESMCCAASRSGNLEDMLAAYYPNEAKTDAARYTAELYLWALAMPDQQWLDKLPHYYQLSKRGLVAAKQLGFIHKITTKLSKLYDQDIPQILRLQSMASWYDLSRRSPSFDKELLATAAVRRWIERQGFAGIAAPLHEEYRCQSLRATSGKSDDALKLWTLG